MSKPIEEMSVEELNARYDELSNKRRNLELSDDSLFVNANGNLPWYNDMGSEMMKISNRLKELK